MAKTKDFRTQTATPATPAAGVVSYYVGTSGELKYVNSAGQVRNASSYFAENLANSNITATGFGIFRKATSDVTGLLYGSSGTYTVPTILGEPSMWFSVLGPSGQLLAIPAYNRS